MILWYNAYTDIANGFLVLFWNGLGKTICNTSIAGTLSVWTQRWERKHLVMLSFYFIGHDFLTSVVPMHFAYQFVTAQLTPVLSAMQRSLGIGIEQTKAVFITVFLFAHGYASIIANNELKYDEDTINSHLERAYRGAILAAQEEKAWKNVRALSAHWLTSKARGPKWMKP